MTFIVAALLMFEIQTPAQAPAPQATIRGFVTRATTGDPIAGAQVTITRAAAAAGARPPAAAGPEMATSLERGLIPAVTTDERGRFEINDVAPGAYRIAAARNGYSRQEYGQRSANRAGTPINVSAGQRIDDIVFRLTPAATITGRVTDNKGEPLAGVTIQALRSTYDAAGKRTLQPVASGRTNDLGEYRLYWINPGRYFVSANPGRSTLDMLTSTMSQSPTDSSVDAQPMSQFSSIFGAPPNPNEVPQSGFALTFYPGTPDLSRAASIDLPAGAENHADFVLARNERFRIRGRVIDARTNRPPQGASVSISPRTVIGGSFFDSLLGIGGLQGNRYNSTTGEFEVRDVAPGSYWLAVTTQPQVPNQAQGTQPPSPSSMFSSIGSTQVPVDVFGGDLDNVTVSVSASVSIPGRLRMDSNEPLPRVSLAFQPTGGNLNLLSLFAGAVQPDANGAFSIPGVTPGEYKLRVNGLPADVYVKEARLENKDPLEGLTILDRIDGSLDVTLSSRSAQIDGTVAGLDGKPAANVQVVLVPERLRNRQDLYKTATTNQDGRFNMRGIAPGDYRVFAWEDIEPFAYFDPDGMKQYESQGRLIHVEESSKVAVETKLIPASN